MNFLIVYYKQIPIYFNDEGCYVVDDGEIEMLFATEGEA